jgi:hypothetical protein
MKSKRTIIIAVSLLAVAATCLVFYLWPSRIRVQNETGHDFAAVTVANESSGEAHALGSVKSGATSQYSRVRSAYADASVFTRDAKGYAWNRRIMNPSDRLWSGRYTYVLRMDTNDMMDVTLRRDR